MFTLMPASHHIHTCHISRMIHNWVTLMPGSHLILSHLSLEDNIKRQEKLILSVTMPSSWSYMILISIQCRAIFALFSIQHFRREGGRVIKDYIVLKII